MRKLYIQRTPCTEGLQFSGFTEVIDQEYNGVRCTLLHAYCANSMSGLSLMEYWKNEVIRDLEEQKRDIDKIINSVYNATYEGE